MMRREQVSRHSLLVSLLLTWVWRSWKSQASGHFSLSHSLSASALASGIFIAHLLGGGLTHHTVVEVGHVSLLGDVVDVLLWFFSSVAEVHGFWFP